MESKIMLVFYGNDCLPYKDKERQVHYPIVGNAFLGASDTTKIRFYFDRIGNASTTWVSVAKLPNGKQGSRVLTTTYDSELGENYAELELSNWYTQAKGDVYIALQGYQGGVQYSYDSETELYTINGTPTIQTTGSIKLAINYAPIGDSADYNDEFSTYQEILAALGDKLDVLSGIVVVNNILTETASNYEEGQMFFSLHDKQIWKKGSSYFEPFKDTRLQTASFLESTTVDSLLQAFGGDSTGILTITDGDYSGRYLFFYQRGTSTPMLKYPTFVCLNTGRIIWSTSGYGGTTTLQVILLLSQKFEWYSKTQVESALALKADKSDTYTKSQVDDLIGSVKQNEFQVVSELPEEGEEGIIYLIPIDPSDTSLGYEQYIWEESENDYIYLGTTNIDLRNYYTKDQTDTLLSQKANSSDVYTKSQTYSKTETDNLLATKENLSNKTTTLSGSSTDTQYPSAKVVYDQLATKENVANKVISVSASSTDTEYPSAKCVYDIEQNLREVAEGKCKSFVVSCNITLEQLRDAVVNDQMEVYDAQGHDISSSIADGTHMVFIDGLLNPRLNSDSNYLTTLAIFLLNTTYLHNGMVLDTIYEFGFKTGDLLLVVETQVPDRWYSEAENSLFKLETTKVDLSGFYSKSESLLPTTTNTYDLGSSTYTFKDAYIGGKIEFPSYKILVENGFVSFQTTSNSLNIGLIGTSFSMFRSLLPTGNNTYNLGRNDYAWKDLYLSGAINMQGQSTKGFVKLTQAQYDALVSGGTVDADTFYFIEE